MELNISDGNISLPLAYSTRYDLLLRIVDIYGNILEFTKTVQMPDMMPPSNVRASVDGNETKTLFNQAVQIVFSSNDASDSFGYTIDTTAPEQMDGNLTKGINASFLDIAFLAGSTTVFPVKFFAFTSEGAQSTIYTKTYTVDGIAPTVSISKPSGTYSQTQTVSLRA